MNSRLDTIESSYDPNVSVEMFYSIINDILSKHAPVKEKRVKRYVQPEWFNEEIKCAINKRNTLHKLKKYDEFKMQRNLVSSLIRKSKKNFYNNAISNCKSTSSMWKNMRCISGNVSKNKSFQLPPKLVYNDTVKKDDYDILNAFNEHFINIANIIEKKKFVMENFSELKHILDKKLVTNVFEIEYISAFEVKKIIDNLNPKKSSGLDGVGPRILKYCGDFITPSIAYIINQSIDTGCFPDKLKEAFVLPIYKTGNREDPNNYRPISILPSISKIFERHIASQLLNFFKTTDILHKTQSGFRQNHSCQTALIHMINTWLNDIDSGKYVGAVFLDLRKAFDLVDHEILLHKLHLYHFSSKSIKLFSSYLSNRMQVIKVGNSISSTLKVTSGVPQGSILGPLLFLLYINDISYNITSGKIDLYADDSTLHESDKDLIILQNKLQINLDKIHRWCKVNNMSLHPTKSKCMIISTKNKFSQNKNLKLHLTIDNLCLENVTVQKVLGVFIDNTLTWNIQLSKISAKINTKIALLKRIIHYLTDDMKMLFYNAYILSTMDYCCILWGNSKKCINTMNKLQERTARIIKRNISDNSDSSVVNDLHWLSFENRCKYHLAVLVYQRNLTPNYILELLSFSSNETYSLRSISNNQMMMPKIRTNYMKQSFSYKSTKTWNEIPVSIRSKSSVNVFKKSLQNYLLNE